MQEQMKVSGVIRWVKKDARGRVIERGSKQNTTTNFFRTFMRDAAINGSIGDSAGCVVFNTVADTIDTNAGQGIASPGGNQYAAYSAAATNSPTGIGLRLVGGLTTGSGTIAAPCTINTVYYTGKSPFGTPVSANTQASNAQVKDIWAYVTGFGVTLSNTGETVTITWDLSLS